MSVFAVAIEVPSSNSNIISKLRFGRTIQQPRCHATLTGTHFCFPASFPHLPLIMPAVRFSASPPPRPPPPPPGTGSPEEAPAQPVRSALAHPEQSLEATFGLIFQSHDRRYGEQDACPPRNGAEPHPACDIIALKRRSNPSRPARPTSGALQGAQAYLDATVKPSTMRLKDVEAWVEDSLQAQAMYGMTPSSPLDPSAPSSRRWSEKPRSGEWPSFEPPCEVQNSKMETDEEPLRRMKSSSFSSSFGKRLARTPSDLVNWFKSPSAQALTPRSRSISQATESNEEEQVIRDRRWSTSSRRRALRHSDGSQRVLAAPSTPPTYRSVLNGLHRRLYSTDSSDSSWSSFGCIDGMRRPDAGAKKATVDKTEEDIAPIEGHTDPAEITNAKKGASLEKKKSKEKRTAERNVENDCASTNEGDTTEENNSATEVSPVSKAWKKIAGRIEVPVRQTRPHMESDTSCAMPY